jgi:hypothetical protein
MNNTNYGGLYYADLQPHITSLLLGTNNPVSILLSRALSLRYSPSVRDQVSSPYKAIGKLSLSYFISYDDWWYYMGRHSA